DRPQLRSPFLQPASSDTPPPAHRLQQLLEVLSRPGQVQTCYTLFVSERLSPSARERVLADDRGEGALPGVPYSHVTAHALQLAQQRVETVAALGSHLGRAWRHTSGCRCQGLGRSAGPGTESGLFLRVPNRQRGSG